MTNDALDEALFATLWSALEQQPLSALHVEDIASAAGQDMTAVYVRYADSSAMLIAALRALDTAALADAATAFADAPEASVYEKLLEGLICRFERYDPLRVQMQRIREAGQRNPIFAACLLLRLADTVDRLLMLCGDHTTGWRRHARIKGVVGVLLGLHRVWQDDNTPDLSLTLSALDSKLRRAAQWAVSFGVLSAQDIDEDHAQPDSV